MPVQFSFNVFAESKPSHGQDIIYLRNEGGSFGSFGVSPREAKVEYSWLEVDENGDETGSSTCYHPHDEQPEGHILQVLFDDEVAGPDALWMDDDTYFNIIENHLRKYEE